MKEIIIVPVIGLFIIGFAVELESIATDSGKKALKYASDMNNAMDCAMVGVPIRECSPELMETDFTPEIEDTTALLENMTLSLSDQLEGMDSNATVNLEGINETENVTVYIVV